MLGETLMVNGAIQLTSRVAQAMRATRTVGSHVNSSSNSLTDVASVGRVEPIVMVDSDVANLKESSDILQALHSMFSGYYLQAVNMTATINGVSVAHKLAPFNPNRSAFESFRDFAVMAAYGDNPFQFRLPTSKNERSFAFEETYLGKKDGIEEARAKAYEAQKAKAEGKKDDKKDKKQDDGVEVDFKAIDKIGESANLSVGKMFNVTIRVDNNAVVVPVAIRLLVNVMPEQQMVDLFTFRDSFDLSMKERFHAWRSGRLSFWKDLVLCNDLVDKYRKAAIKDKSGLTEAILNREANHITASLASQKVSLATATNLAVITTETLAQIESRLNGPFKNKQVRDSVFSNTNLMILAVVDRHWERVTFYHRGLDQPSNLSFNEIKGSNKSGTDVTDIMKAYMLGNAPQL